MIEIREAKYTDIFDLFKLVQEFFIVSRHALEWGVSLKEKDALMTIKSFMDNPDLCLFIGLNDGNLEGIIIGGIRPWILNFDEKIAFELGYYVRPKSRKGRLAKLLISKFEEWAKENGALAIEVGSIVSVEGKRVSKLFERLGYPQIINGHVKRLGV